MFSLRLNERRGGCMSRKIHFYILIFFEVLLALSMLRSYGLHFEYETLNSVSLLSSQLPQQAILIWFVFRFMKDKRKVEGILAVFAFHICQLVTYFIVPASIFKPWLVSPVLTVICLIWLVIMMKKTELPMLLASFKSPSAWQSSVPLLGLGMIAVMWATHYVKITTKDISGIFYILYPVLECASIFLFLTLMTEINRKKLRISSILIVVISLLELVYGFLVDHIITDVSLFLLVVSSYLVYRTNGNTSTLVEKWQQKYGFEVRKDNLLVEKKTKPVIEKRKIYDYAESQRQLNPLSLHSPWLWTAFILALRNLVINLTSVFYYPTNDPNPLAGLDWFIQLILMTPLIIIPTMMLPRAISTANKNRLYVVAGLFIVSYGSIEQLIVPALILYGVSKIKEE
jgi:putative membrane protein